MTTLPKSLLTLSIVGFAISLSGPGAEFADGIIKPLSAICFVLFYITNLLAKEVAAYDQEQYATLELLARIPAPESRAGTDAGSNAEGHGSHSFAGAATR